MPDLGLEVLWKGKNAARLLAGLWTALRISLISVVISIPLGILLGALMTRRNPIVRHRVHPLGNGGDERSGSGRAHFHPKAPV